jgi:hypothetical protein
MPYSGETGRMRSENICSSSEGAQGEGKRTKEGMKLNLPPKLVEKLVWVPIILFCRISFPVKHLMPYSGETGRMRSENICSSREGAQGEGKRREEGMKLNLPPKLVEKLVWVPIILFSKISFPVKHLMPYSGETGRSPRPQIA